MGESTQYAVLLIVGFVGLVAMFSMAIIASPPSAESQTMAGQATQSLSDALDYNNDGVIDQEDARILADSIAYGTCPIGKICDLNGDGVLDEQDLALFNTLIYDSSDEVAETVPSVAKPYAPTRIVGYSSVTTTLA